MSSNQAVWELDIQAIEEERKSRILHLHKHRGEVGLGVQDQPDDVKKLENEFCKLTIDAMNLHLENIDLGHENRSLKRLLKSILKDLNTCSEGISFNNYKKLEEMFI